MRTTPSEPAGRIRWLCSLGLIALAVIVLLIVLYLSTLRSLSTLELLLFQLFILLVSLLGAYLFGINAKRKSEEWALKQYARAAFRRVLTLYRSLVRMAEFLAREDTDEESSVDVRVILASLRATVLEQIGTLQDALEDWRDVIPSDVEDIEEKLADVRCELMDGGSDD